MMEKHLPSWLHKHPGEHRWPAALAVVSCLLLQISQAGAAFPDLLKGIILSIEFLLLIVLIAFNPKHINKASKEIRYLGLSLLVALTIGNSTCVWVLIQTLLFNDQGMSAVSLLLHGGTIWIINILIFALWFWELDRGGPAARANGKDAYPDFLFPQMENENLAQPGWRPVFVDYLYLSFTNGTAFSPTDTDPLSAWAKILMALESAISLSTLAIIIARAVNVA